MSILSKEGEPDRIRASLHKSCVGMQTVLEIKHKSQLRNDWLEINLYFSDVCLNTTFMQKEAPVPVNAGMS